MQRLSRSIPLWMGIGFCLALPLLGGCSLIAGKAVSTGIGSVTDVDVTPVQVVVKISSQQQFRATAKKVLGNSNSVDPDWAVTGGIGYIDQTGLFTATNPGQGTIRATVDTVGGAGNVVGKATVFVSPPDPASPIITAASVDPKSGSAGTVLTFTATVQAPNGLQEVQRVMAQELVTGFSVALSDDGAHNGDATAGDGIYTGRFTIPPSVNVNLLKFGLHADDFSTPPNSSAWSWVTVTTGIPS